MKKQTRPRPALTNLLNMEERQPLVPRICDECYDMLMTSILDAGGYNIVAGHCPHYMTLMEVELKDGIPLGAVMTGPITKDEAGAKINEEFGFE